MFKLLGIGQPGKNHYCSAADVCRGAVHPVGVSGLWFHAKAHPTAAAFVQLQKTHLPTGVISACRPPPLLTNWKPLYTALNIFGTLF
jgi:hypothetical protein